MKKKVWDNTCKVSKSRVELTFESKADTTVPVYYTKESFVNGKPDEIIVLKANERKTTIINKPEIYRFGVTQYNPTGLGSSTANKNITFAGVKGTILDGNYLFNNVTSLVDTDLTYLDTSKMTSMLGMFERVSQLKKIDTSNWDTSNVTNMLSMFMKCKSLTYIDTSNWDISKVTNMDSMFYGCTNLYLTTFESFLNKDFLKVSNTDYMFGDCVNMFKNPTDVDYTTSINKIDLSNFSVIGLEMFLNVEVHKWVPIKIGKNIKQIGHSTIEDYDNSLDWTPQQCVDHFEVEDNDLVYTSDDKKLLISKDGKVLYDVADNIEGTLVIPEGIEKIRPGCARLLSIVNTNNIEQVFDNEYDKLPDNYYVKTYKGINTLDFPSTLINIGNTVMEYTDLSSNNPVLKIIICRAIEPPIVEYKLLSYRGFDNLTLKVPSESIDKYKAANWWKNFKDIQAIQ